MSRASVRPRTSIARSSSLCRASSVANDRSAGTWLFVQPQPSTIPRSQGVSTAPRMTGSMSHLGVEVGVEEAQRRVELEAEVEVGVHGLRRARGGEALQARFVQEQARQQDRADVVAVEVLLQVLPDRGQPVEQLLARVDGRAVGEDRRVGRQQDRVAAADAEQGGVAERRRRGPDHQRVLGLGEGVQLDPLGQDAALPELLAADRRRTRA